MGMVVSLILIALGAILTWAVTREAEGIDLDVVGVILMVVGLVGFVLSMLFWSSWGGPGAFRRRATYVEGDYPPATYGRRTRVVEEEDAGPPGPPGPPPP